MENSERIKEMLKKLWNWIKKNPETVKAVASCLPTLILPNWLDKWIGVIPAQLVQTAISEAQGRVRMSDASKRQFAASIIKMQMKERFNVNAPDSAINFLIELYIAEKKAKIGPRLP